MKYPKEILVKDYFEIHNYYSKIYGYNRTIILIQVGSFHEIYSIYDNDNKNQNEIDNNNLGIDLVYLSQKLDVCCTKKNSNLPLSKSNPKMIGFPIYVTHNFIEKLIDLDYTIILIDQVSEPPNPKRDITNIYSPATYINKKNNNSLFLICIVLDKIKNTNNNQLCIGLSSYDLSTGEGSIYETYSKSDDTLLGLDNVNRFLEKYPPREIILINNIKDDIINNMTYNDILGYFNIDYNIIYDFNIINHKQISWQKKILESVYKIETNIDIIEFLGLQFYNWARLSLVILLDYVILHQSNLLEHLSIPTIFNNDKYLFLGNKALDQLNILTKNNFICDYNKNNNETNLLNIINYTKTSIGKKYLINQLTLPLIEPIEINNRYDIINNIIENKHYVKLVNYLEDIYDLDKLNRKIEINIINPFELYQLYISFYQIIKILDYLINNNLHKYFNLKKKYNKSTNDLYEWIDKRFIINKINGLNFNNFTESDYSFYQLNIHKDIDDILININLSQNFMNNLIKVLELHIDDKKADTQSLITLKCNDRDGYYLLITKKRCDILLKKIKPLKTLNLEGYILDINDLEFCDLPKSASTKISCKKMKEISNKLINYKSLMAKKLKETFKLDIKYFYEEFGNILNIWKNRIAYIDFINSGALCAINNHYTKPIININNLTHSYFKATELRHPIIEKINKNTNYVPHTIELGTNTNQNGILLYGINSSGKSTLMKSIGLNIILAQIGYYTASSYFEYYPYKSLFTRINSNDNMFKGLSSFMVEMMELMAILKRNNSNTLIIGDEICKGTEEKSANIIVCYILETLSKSNSSFITATHLHNIANLESVKKINNIKIKHLKLTYDSTNDILIYDRDLLDGQGDSFYGLQVAKYIMKDSFFNERTNEILQEYNNNIIDKKSRYNKNIYMNCCEICKSQQKLESHHIIWQKDFNNNINKNNLFLQKNSESNLVVLCSLCHDKVDRNEIIINGWKETSNGIIFDYEIISNKLNNSDTKSKYSQEIIDFIKNNKEICNNDPKMCRIKIKEEYDIKISTKTINSFWI